MAATRSHSAWSFEDLRLLRLLWPNTPAVVIAERLAKSNKAVSSRAKVLGLRKAPGYVRNPNVLSPDEISFLKVNYLRYPNPVLSKMMGRGESTIQSYRKKLGIEGKENTGRFKKGTVPWTKGKKMPPGWGGATRFQKGQLPKNTKEDGDTTVRYSKGRPYIWVRIAQAKWEMLHRIIWEKLNGTIPHGYNVQFRDGNSLNCNPSNLYLINRSNQMMNNTIHRYAPELKSLIRLSAKLNRKISSYEKQT